MADTFAFQVNGQSQTVNTDPDRPLLEVLREDLGLTGPNYGCGEGRCGACTVLVSGEPRASCTTPMWQVQDQSILTIEGLAQGETLHPVHEAFLAENAFQCGYCTPGMILAVVALLEERPPPSEAEIRSRLEGHLCRCCGYPNILKAVRRLLSAP